MFGLAFMFWFCSYHRMRATHACDPSLIIPPIPVMARTAPVLRFIPAQRTGRLARRAMRDFTGFLALAWAVAELCLWAGV